MLPAIPGGDRKRRRIAIACDECRDRKRKCDGVKPVCGTCAKRGSSTPCAWDEGRIAKGWSNSYVESLRIRIQELEQCQAKNNDSSAFRPPAERASQAAQEGSSITSSVQFMPEGADECELRGHDQAVVSPGTINTLIRNTMDTSGNAQFCRRSTDKGQENPAGSVLSDRHSVIDDDEVDDESRIDAMGVFGPIGDRDGRRSFFGPSSTLGFLSQARRAMSQSTVGTDRGQDTDPLLGLFRDEGVSVGGSPQAASLEATKTAFRFAEHHHLCIPPRHQADALLDNFWAYFHSLYPVLHKPSFMDRYLTLWAPSSRNGSEPQQRKGYYAASDDKSFHCLLNLTFALGAQFGTAVDGAHQRQLGLIFFNRAKVLLDFDVLARGDIFLVQTLIILGHYLQSTDMASACWNMVGLAIRVAQGIGLHHEPDYCEQGCCSRGRLSQMETEMRRRSWTSCVLLDRVLSMTYGRPLMIRPAASGHGTSLSAIDDEFLSDSPTALGAQPEGSPSQTEYYVQAINLQDILGEVLSTLYSGSGDINFNFMAVSTANDKLNRGELQTLLNIDTSLSAWERSLPDYLKARTYNFMGFTDSNLFGSRTPTFNRQAIILHARYLHVRLIMFRPVLSAVSSSSCKDIISEQGSSMQSGMRQGMLDKGVNMCVSSARDLVELITGNLDLSNEVLPPSWHNVFYMHSCSVVFLICRLCCLSRIQDKEGLIASWKKCLAFFYTNRSRSRSAKRCLKILQAFQRRALPSDPVIASDKGSAKQKQRCHTLGSPMFMEQEQMPNPLFDETMVSGQEAANWIGDPSEMNWLSFFPSVDDLGDSFPEPQFRETPYY